MQAKFYPGMFKRRYPVLRGRDWIRTVDSDDLQAFTAIGAEHFEYGRMGGRARAQAAYRDERGRFKRNEELPNV